MRHLGQMNSVTPRPTARMLRQPAQRTWTGAEAGEGDESPAIGGDLTARVPEQRSGGVWWSRFPFTLGKSRKKPKRYRQWDGRSGPVFEDFDNCWVANGKVKHDVRLSSTLFYPMSQTLFYKHYQTCLSGTIIRCTIKAPNS